MESFMKESNLMDAFDNLYDIAMEAVAQRREQEEDKVKEFVLPRLALQSKILPPPDAKIPENIPAIPRKKKLVNVTAMTDHDRKPTWFFVQSPRETYGVVGPFSVPDLQVMYKYGDIDDDTYLWQPEQKNHIGDEVWLPLREILHLRYKIVNIPDMPEKMMVSEEEARGNPYASATEVNDSMREGRDKIDRFEPSAACTQCGAPATCYIPRELFDPDQKEKIPDIAVLRGGAGSTKACSETIPGYLWIGTAQSAKASVFYQMDFSLIICCCSELRNPSQKPPNYRCKRAQLDDNPPIPDDGSEKSKEFIESVISKFDEVHDWIEFERIHPDRGVESDPSIPDYRGPTDQYGRPPIVDNGVPKKPKEERLAKGYKVLPPSRVLVWSKSGNDRAPAMVCAYLIRRWGISLMAALQIVGKAREVLNICPAYMYILKIYESRHWIGELLCDDCSLKDQLPSVNKDVYNNLSADWLNRELSVKGGLDIDEDGEKHENKGITGEEMKKMLQKKAFLAQIDIIAKRLTTDSVSEKGEFIKRSIQQIADPNFQSCDPDLAISLKSSPCLTKLGPTSLYIKPVPPSAATQLSLESKMKYGNLVDLSLAGRMLGDEGTIDLFTALSLTDVIGRIRLLDLKSNNIGDSGAVAIAQAFTYQDPVTEDHDVYHTNFLEIVSMNLSDNHIGVTGCTALGEMLRYANSMSTLNMSNNRTSDEAISKVITAIGIPALGFDEADDDDVHDDEEKDISAKFLKPHNNSLTDLRLMNNNLGDEATAAIEKLLGTNKTLTGLHLDFCTSLSNKNLKTIIRGIKKYNLSIQMLSLSDVKLTTKLFDAVMRLFEKPVAPVNLHVPIRRLNIARCGINESFLPKWPNIMRTGAIYLTALDISGNPLGDEGIKTLGEALIASAVFLKKNRMDNIDNFESGSQISEVSMSVGEQLPGLEKLDLSEVSNSKFIDASKLIVKFIPLRTLNVSTCNIGPKGILNFLDCISRLLTLEVLDVSHNNIGPRPSYISATANDDLSKGTESDDDSVDSSEAKLDKMDKMAQYLGKMQLRELKMNNCRLYTRGCTAVMKMLQTTDSETCGNTLRSLLLSGNDVYNSIAPTLLQLLQSNFKLEVLDLGFNKLTKQFNDDVRGKITTTSSSTVEEKLNNLTVTLMGNECDPFLFDAPGMARSKNTTHFRSSLHSSLETYDYVPSGNARRSFMERVKYDNMAYEKNRNVKHNTIS